MYKDEFESFHQVVEPDEADKKKIEEVSAFVLLSTAMVERSNIF